MFKGIVDWLDWNVRIRFMDEVWDKLFPADQTPHIRLTGAQLKAHRVEMGLTPWGMAKWLMVKEAEYKRWEKEGMLSPHDTEGPAVVMINMAVIIRSKIGEQQDMLRELGWPGKI